MRRILLSFVLAVLAITCFAQKNGKSGDSWQTGRLVDSRSGPSSYIATRANSTGTTASADVAELKPMQLTLVAGEFTYTIDNPLRKTNALTWPGPKGSAKR